MKTLLSIIKENLKLHDIVNPDVILIQIEKILKFYFELNGNLEKALSSSIKQCPRCSSNKIIKHGKDKGVQRFFCKYCTRTFTTYTGTALAGIHKKETFFSYIQEFSKELTLEQCTKYFEISKQTAHTWRHKILSSLKDYGTHILEGITEVDQFFLKFSEKGKNKYGKGRKRGKYKGKLKEHEKAPLVGVQTCISRNGGELYKVYGLRGPSKKQLEKVTNGRISTQATVCCDSHASMMAFLKSANINSIYLNSSKNEMCKGIYHIQHINAAHKYLRDWINEKFNGVATKYLQKYLNWFHFKRQSDNNNSQILLQTILKNTFTNDIFNAITTDYKLMI